MVYDSEARHRTRKLVTFGGCIAVGILVLAVHSGKLGVSSHR
ncbi:MAG: hypothetical protein OEW77_09010 [Gemmatimonadota bacterium]|nr:hypothetical protein [Gemmatimonadota bacterium]